MNRVCWLDPSGFGSHMMRRTKAMLNTGEPRISALSELWIDYAKRVSYGV